VVVVPVFEDMEEMQTSPYKDEDWYEERMSWKWMNTIMRVNSLVQKVRLILCTRSSWFRADKSIDGDHRLRDCPIHLLVSRLSSGRARAQTLGR
jgi:hypothetical protein